MDKERCRDYCESFNWQREGLDSPWKTSFSEFYSLVLLLANQIEDIFTLYSSLLGGVGKGMKNEKPRYLILLEGKDKN
jgi:hypothetical protein